MVEMYQGSDGDYYSEDELWRQYESGRWQFCMGEVDTGREVVQTETGDLLTLTPVREGRLGFVFDDDTERGRANEERTSRNDADGPAISYVPPEGHCRTCGEPLVVEPCPNCEARRRLDD